MTREEAITVFKAFIENPLFSYEHKQAFNIAIHDIQQRHEWDINNLILINKENYESAEQELILDKIRAEIEHDYEQDKIAREVFRDKKIAVRAEQCTGSISAYRNVLGIIDKYKGRKRG